MESTPLHKAVFFDRDGTINSDEGHYYIYKPEDFVFNPGVVEGMKRLQDAGYLLFVITNQGGVAKGIYTCEDVDRVHAYMCSELAKQGIQLTKIYYCPHHESVQATAAGTWSAPKLPGSPPSSSAKTRTSPPPSSKYFLYKFFILYKRQCEAFQLHGNA